MIVQLRICSCWTIENKSRNVKKVSFSLSDLTFLVCLTWVVCIFFVLVVSSRYLFDPILYNVFFKDLRSLYVSTDFCMANCLKFQSFCYSYCSIAAHDSEYSAKSLLILYEIKLLKSKLYLAKPKLGLFSIEHVSFLNITFCLF